MRCFFFLIVSFAVANAADSYELVPPVFSDSADDIAFAPITPKIDFRFYKQAGVCVDYTVEGYFYKKTRHPGSPPSGYVTRPQTITPCELEELHNYCVNRINQYRSGQLKFSDGTTDSNVAGGLQLLTGRKGSQTCSSEAALGDLIANYEGGGGCAGAHNNAFVCPGSGAKAQNSCCGRGDGANGRWDTAKLVTFNAVKGQLDNCLQMMWDEGITPGQKGHWETMRSRTYTHVSCGFAWSTGGRLMMTQDFYTSNAACTPQCRTCGGADGCSTNPCFCDGQSDTTSETGHSGSDKTNPAVVGGAVVGAIVVVGAFGFFAHKHIRKNRTAKPLRDPLTKNSIPALSWLKPAGAKSATKPTRPNVVSPMPKASAPAAPSRAPVPPSRAIVPPQRSAAPPSKSTPAPPTASVASLRAKFGN